MGEEGRGAGGGGGRGVLGGGGGRRGGVLWGRGGQNRWWCHLLSRIQTTAHPLTAVPWGVVRCVCLFVSCFFQSSFVCTVSMIGEDWV